MASMQQAGEQETETKRRRLTSDAAGSPAPDADAAMPSTDAPAETPMPEDEMRRHLHDWGQKLVNLHPKIFMSEALIDAGLTLFRRFQFLRSLHVAVDNGDLATTKHDLAACFWVAIKFCSRRNGTPNRSFVARVAGMSPSVLGDRELALLMSMDWKVACVLRVAGLDALGAHVAGQFDSCRTPVQGPIQRALPVEIDLPGLPTTKRRRITLDSSDEESDDEPIRKKGT